MTLVNSLDSRSYLVRQGNKVPAHSPHFNERGWRNSAEALTLANAPKAKKAKVKASTKVREHEGGNVAFNVMRLNRVRFDSKVEEQKVKPMSTEQKRAKLLGFTVKTLRAQCKAEGLKGYSKAKKATLVDMLVGS